ncbi:Cytochrome P450 67 [Diplodia seriata]|uniref:Cytochrome P450 67 n=1 Tax=Diplodia seriata TaxID=420778 RepID=A0A1S8BCD2_9PEZI|nr:Cytochrome P450 67 [Diplodia seriata]
MPFTSMILGSSVHVATLRLKLDNHAWHIVGLWDMCLLLLFLVLAPTSGILLAIRQVLLFAFSFLSGFFGSMAIYRLFFSPIRHFPGPRIAALTSFYRVYASIRSNIRLFSEIEKLHQQYGDYVRVGPREISILNPAAIPLLYGSKTQCRRGPWYDHISGKEEDKHVLLVKDPATHSWRRRILDRGLSSKALVDYEHRIQRTVDELIAALDARTGTPIDMTEWVNFFSFDAMGRIAYNHDFGMLKNGVDTVSVEGRSTSLKALHSAMKALGVLGPVPWLFRMIGQTGAGGEITAFFQWCHEAMHMKQRVRLTPRALANTSSLLILAGSDTTASAITNALFYLSCNPPALARLRAELDAASPSPSVAASPPASPYLDAVINETLRLKPPACGSLGREIVAPAGLTLPDGTHIPAGVVAAVPTWALQRDARWWGADAGVWRPERWEGLKTDGEAAAFIPFSRGAGRCPGERLAYVEMRRVVAGVVGRFEVRLAEGQGVAQFDEGGVDAFTLGNPPLRVVVERRSVR